MALLNTNTTDIPERNPNPMEEKFIREFDKIISKRYITDSEIKQMIDEDPRNFIENMIKLFIIQEYSLVTQMVAYLLYRYQQNGYLRFIIGIMFHRLYFSCEDISRYYDMGSRVSDEYRNRLRYGYCLFDIEYNDDQVWRIVSKFTGSAHLVEHNLNERNREYLNKPHGYKGKLVDGVPKISNTMFIEENVNLIIEELNPSITRLVNEFKSENGKQKDSLPDVKSLSPFELATLHNQIMKQAEEQELDLDEILKASKVSLSGFMPNGWIIPELNLKSGN